MNGNYAVIRNSPRRCAIEKGVLKIFSKFIGKHLRQSLFFNKIAALSLRLWHGRFPVNFAKFPRMPFLQSTSGRLHPYHFLKHPCQFSIISFLNFVFFSIFSMVFYTFYSIWNSNFNPFLNLARP